ncbi:hypothetical protein H4582DRAFT_230822 [Lactarius indigo]|nr:hypothetical protein H4582DRAFT_230822 [Lactarius indigo]
MGDASHQVLAAREKRRHFRILVVGRAISGKTTLIKRVCNTTDEPRIYDEKSNSLLEPISERGIRDIDRPFAFPSKPQFIFHCPSGFETGDENHLKRVQSFIEERASATEVDDQLHAIWSLLLSRFVALPHFWRRFCFILDKARFIVGSERKFFNEQRAGNIPVIAIFTKFDYLISQVYDVSLEEDDNRMAAESLLKDDIRASLYKCKFPPRADVCLEGAFRASEQVKELIRKTAESIDDLSLKTLFVSL